MARIKLQDVTEEYKESLSNSSLHSDSNDCAVIAVSIITGLPYKEVRELFKEKGRKTGRGSPGWMTDSIVKELGYKLIRVPIKGIISSFPKPHCDVLKNLTTHHPRRFPGCLDPEQTYLARTRGHILAIKDGKVHDWTVNKSARIWQLKLVVKEQP